MSRPKRTHYKDILSIDCGLFCDSTRSHYISQTWEDVDCPECLKHKPKNDSLDKNIDIYETIPAQLHVRRKGSPSHINITKEGLGVLVEFFYDGHLVDDGSTPITKEEWPHVRNAIDQLIGVSDE